MEVFGIFMISITMLFGSYAAGCLPLFFTLNEGRIRLTSVFGAGILIGTTLCVIIPEGISAFYESSISLRPSAEKMQPAPLVRQNKDADWLETFERIQATLESAIKENSALRHDLDELRVATSMLQEKRGPPLANASLMSSLKRRDVDAAKTRVKRSEFVETTGGDAQPHFDDGNSVIGLALIIGFLFLFAVDHFSKAQAAGRNRSVPTLGLIIHAAADGIAMGSAATATDSDMPMITFFAIMIHKAPAAFALASFLLLEGLEKFRIRRHLLAFSVAAPLATIVTYGFLRNMEANAGSATTGSSTGVILLFSGGTFLYIAASHVLPELVESKAASIGGSSPMSGGSGAVRPHFSVVEVALFVGAALLPSLLSSHHHH